ncbi:MAG: hypothetical protein ACRC50_12235 [Gaiella sp.]
MRKAWLVLVAMLATVVAVVPAATTPMAPSQRTALPPASAFVPHGAFGPRQIVFFGYVQTLTRRGKEFRARIDPSLILTGVTGRAAAVEDGALGPGEPIPNDYYERNERRRPLSYRVPAGAHVTVLVNPGTGPRATVVPVSELAQIVRGRNPEKRPGLWGPEAGFWIRAQGDRVLALDPAVGPPLCSARHVPRVAAA